MESSLRDPAPNGARTKQSNIEIATSLEDSLLAMTKGVMKIHYNIKIYGLVQGVFFRASAKEAADKLEISGFAKNMSDGSVYMEAEGEKENLDKFIVWCNQGPMMAQVEKVEISESPLKNFSRFEVS